MHVNRVRIIEDRLIVSMVLSIYSHRHSQPGLLPTAWSPMIETISLWDERLTVRYAMLRYARRLPLCTWLFILTGRHAIQLIDDESIMPRPLGYF